jgi:hypothetical protein
MPNDRFSRRRSRSAESRSSPSDAALPPLGILLRVHAGHDDDGVTIDPVEKPIWKASRDESAAGISVEDGTGFRILEHSVARQSQRRQEFFTQARSLCLVPLVGSLDVGGGRRPNDDLLH